MRKGEICINFHVQNLFENRFIRINLMFMMFKEKLKNFKIGSLFLILMECILKLKERPAYLSLQCQEFSWECLVCSEQLIIKSIDIRKLRITRLSLCDYYSNLIRGYFGNQPVRATYRK